MAEGFITRRGGSESKFYEGTVELNGTVANIVVGFKPKIVVLEQNAEDKAVNKTTTMSVVFNADIPIVIWYTGTGSAYMRQTDAQLVQVTVTQTNNGITITLVNMGFNGTYTVYATE